jgi:putative cell wall-binding protein
VENYTWVISSDAQTSAFEATVEAEDIATNVKVSAKVMVPGCADVLTTVISASSAGVVFSVNGPVAGLGDEGTYLWRADSGWGFDALPSSLRTFIVGDLVVSQVTNTRVAYRTVDGAMSGEQDIEGEYFISGAPGGWIEGDLDIDSGKLVLSRKVLGQGYTHFADIDLEDEFISVGAEADESGVLVRVNTGFFRSYFISFTSPTPKVTEVGGMMTYLGGGAYGEWMYRSGQTFITRVPVDGGSSWEFPATDPSHVVSTRARTTWTQRHCAYFALYGKTHPNGKPQFLAAHVDGWIVSAGGAVVFSRSNYNGTAGLYVLKDGESTPRLILRTGTGPGPVVEPGSECYGSGGGSVPVDTTAGSVAPGGSLSTDPAGTVPSKSNPVVVSLTSPTGGQVSVSKGSGTRSKPGFQALGMSAEITAPAASADRPLRLTFDVYVGDLPMGAYPQDVTVFRDGTAVGSCPASAVAKPDPCVTASKVFGDVARFTVLTSHPSYWELQADTVGRLAGVDRFATAVEVSKASFPAGNAGAVVLARSDAFPDALVGAPLAAAENAPLLLTTGASLPETTKAEIQRVLPKGRTVSLLGDPKAIPMSIATQLSGMGYKVVRYGGADRFATAVAVAQALGSPSTVLLATGTNFPDALAAGVGAAKAGGVVLLTNGSSMPAATKAYLQAHPGKVYAVGGPAAAAEPSATKLAGDDRFETAVAVANAFFTNPVTVGVATGVGFPDALTGGAQLARIGAPLLLTAPNELTKASSTYLATAGNHSINTAHLYGGTSTLPAAIQTAVKKALGY